MHFDLLPLAGFSFYPMGNFAFIPILFLGFAVLKHDLLHIGLVVQKGLIYSLLTGMLTATYGLCIILFNETFKGLGQRWSIFFSVLFFAAIVFVFEPLKKRIQSIIDNLLFKGKYNYQKTLRALSDTMTSILDLDEIMDKTLKTLTEAMYLDWGYVMLIDDTGDKFRVRSYRGIRLTAEHLFLAQSCPMICELGRRKREVSRHNLDQWLGESNDPDGLEADFSRLKGSVVIPMVFQSDINGVLV